MDISKGNIRKIKLAGTGSRIRVDVDSTNDGNAVVLYSMREMLITSYRITNGGEDITYKVLTSKEEEPDVNDADAWDELVASTALAADAAASSVDNEAHYTAIMVVLTSAANDTHSTCRVILSGTV